MVGLALGLGLFRDQPELEKALAVPLTLLTAVSATVVMLCISESVKKALRATPTVGQGHTAPKSAANSRFDAFDAFNDAVNARFDAVDARFDALDKQLGDLATARAATETDVSPKPASMRFPASAATAEELAEVLAARKLEWLTQKGGPLEGVSGAFLHLLTINKGKSLLERGVAQQDVDEVFEALVNIRDTETVGSLQPAKTGR